MGYAAGYRSGYLGGYLTEADSPINRVEHTGDNPRLLTEMAFEPFGQALTWLDISAYVAAPAGFTIDRGRSGELDEFNVGHATLTLRNENGRWDPENAGGPYFGNLKPRRQLRLSALIGSGALAFTLKRSWVGGDDVLKGVGPDPRPIALFTGETGSFNRNWGIEGRSATVDLEAWDHSSRLDVPVPDARDPITNQRYPVVVSGTTGDCIVQLLTMFGWPTATGDTAPLVTEFCDIDKGEVTPTNLSTPVGDGVPVDMNYLAAIRQFALTEGGEFFISRDGRATFRSRGAAGASRGTWGDDGNKPYHAITVKPADEVLVNEVTVEQSNGARKVASDAASINDYGLKARSWSIFSVPDASILAYQLLARYAQPRERVVGFEPLGRTDVGLWRSIFPSEFGDRARIRLHPVYGTLVDRTLRLEGINISSPNKFDWKVSWSASEVGDAQPNLLFDEQADFEQGLYWFPLTAGSAVAIYTPGTGPKASPFGAPSSAPRGSNVLWVTGDGTPQGGGYTLVELSTPGSYVLGGFFYGLFGSGQMSLKIEWLGIGDAVLATSQVNVGGNFRSWRYAALSTSAPAGVLTARISLLVSGSGDGGNGFVDALELREV